MPAALALAALLTLPRPDTIVVGTLSDPSSLAPHRATDLVAAEIVTNVCETLVRLRPGSLRPEGVLATSWATPDQRVWTLTLREGVVFHDGAPLDAAAVAANLEHLRERAHLPGTRRARGPARAPDHPRAAERGAAFDTLATLLRDPEPATARGADRIPCRHRALSPGRGRAGPDLAPGRGRPLGRHARASRRLLFRRFANEDALARALASGEADVTAALGPEPRRRAAHARRGDARRAGRAQPHLPGGQQRAKPLLGRARAARPVARDRSRRARARAAARPRRAGARGPAPAAARAGHPRARAGPRPRRGPPAARRRPRPARLRDDAHRLAGAATVPARAAARRRPHPRRPGARGARACACARCRAGPSTSRSRRAATSRWRSSAGRPTRSTRTTSSRRSLDSESIGTTNRSRYRSAVDGRPAQARPPGQRTGRAAPALPPGAGPGPARHAVRARSTTRPCSPPIARRCAAS